MIFLDILMIVPTTIFSHNLLILLPSKSVFLLLVKSLFLVTFKETKHLRKFTKLCLHYDANPLLALHSQKKFIPIFFIGPHFSDFILRFGDFMNNKK